MASLKQSAAIGHDPRLHTGAPLLSLLPPPFLRFAGKGGCKGGGNRECVPGAVAVRSVDGTA